MDLLKTYKYGIKTLYYHTTRDGSGEEDMPEKEDNDVCTDDGICKL
jgi:ribonucleoside-diphosphate reductase alpha chain